MSFPEPPGYRPRRQAGLGAPTAVGGAGPCDGTASGHLTQALMVSTLGGLAYESAYAQFWYHDVAAPPFFVALSDGLEFTIRP